MTTRSVLSGGFVALLLVTASGCAAESSEPDAEVGVQEEDVTALPGNYERKSAAEKQAILWSNMASDEYCKSAGPDSAAYDLRALEAWDPPEDDRAFYPPVELPTHLAASASHESYLSAACKGALGSGANPGVSTRERIRTLFAQKGAFDHNGDEIDAPRFKIIHSEGSAAAVVFQTVNGAPRGGFGSTPQSVLYSGLLAPSQQIPGILRIGEAGVPLGDTIFGLALKLFIDGQPSRNIHGMTRINGQENHREPFALPITNMLLWNRGTNFGVVAVLRSLQFVKPDSLQVPIDHFARITAGGRALEEGVTYPHEVSFSPEPRVAKVIHQLLADNRAMDIRQAFRAIPVGTVLYRVKARRNGPNGICNDFAEIGRIVLVSPLVASSYEDRTLFFRHNRGKWRKEDNRSVPWVAGESDHGTIDVNGENRNLVTQDCSN
jgi:hypothetical protein